MVEVLGSRQGQGLWQQRHLLSKEEAFKLSARNRIGKESKSINSICDM